MNEQAKRPVRRVAVIGVGSMGSEMARHARAGGFDLVVCDANGAVVEAFAAEGAVVAGSPADCAGCDAVLILVATPAQLRTVVFGERGLGSIDAADMPRYVIVSSTVAPGDMRELASALSGLPTRIVDAPISGGVVGARKATLTFLVGGADDDVEQLRPFFLTMGKSIFHCGPLGSGQATKTINNIIAISNLMVSAEAYAIATANGLDLERFIPALEAGSARNFLSRSPTEPLEVYAAWSGDERVFNSVRTINQKDIDLALALKPAGLKTPAIDALRRLLGEVNEDTLENWRRIAALQTSQVL